MEARRTGRTKAKQIVYTISTQLHLKNGLSYLITGINDWQAAFEKAGFKNAIVGKEWPTTIRT
jgi:hypothetical protein